MRIDCTAACLAIGALLPAAAQVANEAEKWLKKQGSHYILFSQSGYENDVEFARKVLESGDALLLKKYGVTLARYHVDVYLYPEPNERAGTGSANLRCCSPRGEIRTGSIAFLAPSSPAWKGFKGLTS